MKRVLFTLIMISVALVGISFVCAADAPALASTVVDSEAPAVDAPALASTVIDSEAPAVDAPASDLPALGLPARIISDSDLPALPALPALPIDPIIDSDDSGLCGGYGGAGSVPSSNPTLGSGLGGGGNQHFY